MVRKKVTSDDIVVAIESWLNIAPIANSVMRSEWIGFKEFRLMRGYGYHAEKRVDYYAISCWASRRNERIAFEVKVTRSDWLSEKKQETKHISAMLFSNRFYFVGPKNIFKVEEIPFDCGLLEYDNGKLKVIKKAPYRECMNPTWPFVVSIARRVFKLENEE